MADHDNISPRMQAIFGRFREARIYRGFKDSAQFAEVFNLAINDIVRHLQRETTAAIIASYLGINSEWLYCGRGDMRATDQMTWYEDLAYTHKIPPGGPTLFFFGQEEAQKALPASTPAPAPRPPRDHLSSQERERFDALWDPQGTTRSLLALGDIAEGELPLYQSEHRCQTTLIDAARLGWCLAIDHDNGLVDHDGLRGAARELQWHNEIGIVELMQSKPQPIKHVIDVYEAAIAICRRIVETVAADLQIDLARIEPEAPLTDWRVGSAKDSPPAA